MKALVFSLVWTLCAFATTWVVIRIDPNFFARRGESMDDKPPPVAMLILWPMVVAFGVIFCLWEGVNWLMYAMYPRERKVDPALKEAEKEVDKLLGEEEK